MQSIAKYYCGLILLSSLFHIVHGTYLGQLLSRDQLGSTDSKISSFEIRKNSTLRSFERIDIPWRDYIHVEQNHTILSVYLLLRKIDHLLVNDIVVESINISRAISRYDWMVPAVQNGRYFSTILVEQQPPLNESYLTAYHSKEFYIYSPQISLAIQHLQWDYFFPLRGSFISRIPIPKHVSFFVQLRKIATADRSTEQDENEDGVLLDEKEVSLSRDRLNGNFSLTVPFVYDFIRYGRTHQVVLFCRYYLEYSKTYEYSVTENSLPFYIKTNSENLYIEGDRFFIIRPPQISKEDFSKMNNNKKILDARSDSMIMQSPYIYRKSEHGVSVKFGFHNGKHRFGSVMTVRLLKNCVEEVPNISFEVQPSIANRGTPLALTVPIEDWRTGIYCWTQAYNVDYYNSAYLSLPFQIRSGDEAIFDIGRDTVWAPNANNRFYIVMDEDRLVKKFRVELYHRDIIDDTGKRSSDHYNSDYICASEYYFSGKNNSRPLWIKASTRVYFSLLLEQCSQQFFWKTGYFIRLSIGEVAAKDVTYIFQFAESVPFTVFDSTPMAKAPELIFDSIVAEPATDFELIEPYQMLVASNPNIAECLLVVTDIIAPSKKPNNPFRYWHDTVYPSA